FFFQAEDGIRDVAVTGVQTCALPIWPGQPDDGAARGAAARDEVEGAVGAEGAVDDLVGEAEELGGAAAAGVDRVERVLAAVAIGDDDEDGLAIGAGAQGDLGDAREVAAEDVGVVVGGRAELVEVELLVEAEIGGGALAFAWIAGVPEAGGVGVPGDGAARGAAVDARDDVGVRLAGRDIVDVEVAALGAAGGERDADALAVA